MSDSMTLEQAVRNAIAAEIGAAGFYTLLAHNSEDERARGFFETMASQEMEHARNIQQLGQQLGAGELPDRADAAVKTVETAMGWEGRTDLTYREALEVALAAENNAELVYETWSEQLPDPPSALFSTLARTEEQHAATLRGLLEELDPTLGDSRVAIPDGLSQKIFSWTEDLVDKIRGVVTT
jgi:rubrerythrin